MQNANGTLQRRRQDLQRTRDHVGSQIRMRREDLGISVEWLAEETGMRASHIEACERGEKDLSVGELCALAYCLNVAPWYFYTGLTGRSRASRDRPLGATVSPLRRHPAVSTH
jgi:transcriptional regulator with XRE-family HTH domain